MDLVNKSEAENAKKLTKDAVEGFKDT